MVFKKYIIIACSFLLMGCSTLSINQKTKNDYKNLSDMLIHGGNVQLVIAQWGEPSVKGLKVDGTQVWTYHNRQEGKTFKFFFNDAGKLIASQVF